MKVLASSTTRTLLSVPVGRVWFEIRDMGFEIRDGNGRGLAAVAAKPCGVAGFPAVGGEVFFSKMSTEQKLTADNTDHTDKKNPSVSSALSLR